MCLFSVTVLLFPHPLTLSPVAYSFLVLLSLYKYNLWQYMLNCRRRTPGFRKSPAGYEWALKQEIPVAAPELREQWERGSAQLGALMEKVEMPSHCHYQEGNNSQNCAGAHLGSLGWGSGCEAGGDGPTRMLHWPWTRPFPQPLRCTTAEVLGHRIYPILEFNTHAFFAEKKGKWWRVFQELLFTLRDPCLSEP